jgi:predicted nucleotide-binding protein
MANKSARQKTKKEIAAAVTPQTAIELLSRQIEKAEEMLLRQPFLSPDHKAWENTTREYLIKAFGSLSSNIDAVLQASSNNLYHLMSYSDHEHDEYGASKLSNQLKILQSCIDQLETEIEMSQPASQNMEVARHPQPNSNHVFVVHGHNAGIKESVARFLERLDLEPIILHEKPNAGRTIIEKFSDYSDVHFAVVLLTGDDEGKTKGTDDPLQRRARQNVVLELGYFLGKLGRSRVCALYEDGVDIPSDYQGVLFVPLDPHEKWRFDLVRELKAAGFPVDANKIYAR